MESKYEDSTAYKTHFLGGSYSDREATRKH